MQTKKPAGGSGTGFPSRAVIWAIVGVAVVGLTYLIIRPAGGTVTEIGNDELRELAGKGARLVDVRSAGEYDMGHIEGAELVPPEAVSQTAASWDRSQAVVVYCATGARSAAARDQLASMGFEEVYNLTQGLAGWDGELTTERSAGAGVIKPDGKPVLVEFTSDG